MTSLKNANKKRRAGGKPKGRPPDGLLGPVRTRRGHSPRTGPICPGCGVLRLRKEDVQNAHSRYVDLTICSDCGTEEAVKGFFWQEKARTLYADKIKPEFR